MKTSTPQFSPIYGRFKKIYHSLYFAPCVVFVAMLLITYWSWRASIATLNRDYETVITDHANQTKNELSQRLASYEQIITGGAGLIRSSEDVLQNEWHDYVSTFDITKQYQGIYSIGYIKAFSAAELPEVVAHMQAQGIDFKVTPDTSRDFYTAILYSDPPATQQSSLGVDMFTEPVRRQTMSRARDTGQTSITPPLKPLIINSDQIFLIMYVPQYKGNNDFATAEQRRQALQGYTYAAVKADDFFRKRFASGQDGDAVVVRVSTQDTTGTWQAFYTTTDYDKIINRHGRIARTQYITIYGQNWKLDYSFKATELLPSQRRNTPAWTVLAGLLLAFLLSEVIFLLLKSRANELSNLKEEAVDLAKDELLSLASHQLRTPATTVKQYLGMVLQGFAGDITPTQLSLLEKAYAGNERQLYIINEMLHVAKIDAGRIVLARHKSDINKLVKDVVYEAESDRELANHKLTLKLESKPVILRVDEHMLRMAIENLVSNAIKYTLPGGKITISVRKLRAEVIITVKDTGIGIAQKDMERLYKLFTRLDNPLTENVSGTGVGLYLAKHLVELHGGQLTVTSKPNVGSTFRLTLPFPYKSKSSAK